MIDIDLLSKCCKMPGAPGFEQSIRSFVLNEVSDLVDDVRCDAMGNVIALKKGQTDKRLMVAAHMDEIGFIVSCIDDDGFIRFHTLGGFDPKTLTAQRVIIHGREDVIGVMGAKPIHVMKPEERKKVVEKDEYFIDTGLAEDEVKKLIRIGDPITRERDLIEMGDCINAKSLDNRASVYVLIEALKTLSKQKLDCSLYAVFTVQEEIGLRGATAVASAINPDYSINLDVTMAYDLPGAAAHEMVTKLGHGTAIKILDGMTVCDYRMVNFLRETADESDIKYQMELLPAGGTDTAALQRHSTGGSIAGGISIPLRYLHQVIEMANKKDIEDSIKLLVAAVQKVSGYDWKFK